MANSNNNPQSVIPDVEYNVEGDFVTVPVPEGADTGKVLGAISEGHVGWVEDQGGGTVQQQSDWTETDDTKVTYIQHKPANLVQDAAYVHTDNNFTDADSAKLAGIAAGAEVNVQSNWNESDSSSDAFIANKPTQKPVVAGANISIVDGQDSVTISATVPTVDQTYNSSSANAQSGTAVAEAVGGLLPSITGNASKVLAVNSGATGLEWVTQGGGGLPAVGTYTLRFKFADPTFAPVDGTHSSKGSWTAVDASNGIWDWVYADSDWSYAFRPDTSDSSPSLLPSIDTCVIDGDMTGVINLNHCFAKANKLNGFKVAKGQSGGNSINTTYMFYNCSTLVYVDYGEDLFRTYIGTGTFRECTQLTFVPVINTGEYSTEMFYSCSQIRNVTINGLQYACKKMFQLCSTLEHVNVLYYNNGSIVGSLSSDCSEMFASCYNLREIPLFSISYNRNYNCTQMFTDCKLIQSIPPWVAHMNITSAKWMFLGCYNLRTIPYIKTDSVTDVSDMFKNCDSIESGADTLYQQMSTQSTPPSSYSGCFTNCGSSTPSGTAALATIPAAWGGTGA